MSVVPTPLVCVLFGPAVPSLLFCAIFVLLFIDPNHREGSSENTLNPEFSVSDVCAILSHDHSA